MMCVEGVGFTMVVSQTCRPACSIGVRTKTPGTTTSIREHLEDSDLLVPRTHKLEIKLVIELRNTLNTTTAMCVMVLWVITQE